MQLSCESTRGDEGAADEGAADEGAADEGDEGPAEEEERCCNRTCVLFSGTELVMHVIIYAIMMIFFFFHLAVGIAEEEANQMMRDTGKKLRKMVW